MAGDDAYADLREFAQRLPSEAVTPVEVAPAQLGVVVAHRRVDAAATGQPREAAGSVATPAAIGEKSSAADEDEDPYASLRDFVRQLDAAPMRSSAESDAGNPEAALLAYVQTAMVDRPKLPNGSQPAAIAAKGAGAKAVKAPADADDGPTEVGSEACLTCHERKTESFRETLMGQVFFKNPRTSREKGACETCHGPGSAHVKAGGGKGVGGLITFRPDDTSRTPAENSAVCLTCHDKGNRNYWKGSAHENRDVACTNCHTIMTKVSPAKQLARSTEMETCFQCHKDRRAQMQRSSHMPMREGKVTCSDCHNPHGSATESLLKEATVNDTCYKCHAEKRGPFLFEHAPVRENCLNCHDPHGSTHEYLLKTARPRLCQECHTQGHAFPTSPTIRYAIGNSCQNCHSQVHGSNSPSGPRFQR